MAKKKRKPADGSKPSGHFCRICGERKANEKFSGKGHAAHICKKCAALPIEERNGMEAVRKIGSMAFRHLSESEVKWLRSRLNDSRPAVRDAAQGAHRFKFPRYERNMAKKGITAFSLELYLSGEVYDECGDRVDVHARVFAEDAGILRHIDYGTSEGERESEVRIEPKEAKRFLKAVVHELDAPFWDEDLSDAVYEDDPYLEILPEYRPDYIDRYDDEDMDTEPEAAIPEETREPLWSLRLELNTGEEKTLVFYNQIHDAPVSLYWSLMEYFELDEAEE